MTEKNQNNNVLEDLPLHSLKRFYKTCIRILTKENVYEESQQQEMFLNCYEKLNHVFLLTNNHLCKSFSEKSSKDLGII